MIFNEDLSQLEFILNEKISDHKPILVENFLVWNILCLCRTMNNGFKMDETLDEGKAYCERLKRIATLINRWTLSDPSIEVICLQEVPYLPEYFGIFLDALESEKFDQNSMVFSKTGSHKFRNLTLYSKRYVVEDITHYLSVTSSCQKDRYHILELTDKETGYKQRIGNVHFEWFPKKKMDERIATHEIIRELIVEYNCCLLGDFNQSLYWILDDAVLRQKIKAFYYPRANNISFAIQKDEEQQQIEYGQIDAVILV